jgi:hypothetical protein
MKSPMFLLASLFPALATAAAPPAPRNDLCARAHLSGFSIQAPSWRDGVDDDSEDDLARREKYVARIRRYFGDVPPATLRFPVGHDFCADPEDALPATIRRALVEIAGLHADAAQSLGVTEAQLFPEPIRVILIEHRSGEVGSIGGVDERTDPESGETIRERGIGMGIFPNWGQGTSKQLMVAGIYLHELGHALTLKAHPAFPPILTQIIFNPFFTEGIPDLLGADATGGEVFKSANLPGCLSGLRTLTRSQSYAKYPAAYFQDFGSLRISACCRHLDSKPGLHTPESAYLCRGRLEELREELSLMLEPDQVEEAVRKATESKLDPTPFRPADFAERARYGKLDIHQLAMPVNSFLTSFAREAGIRPIELFLKLVEAASGADLTREWKASCQFVSPLDQLLPQPVQVVKSSDWPDLKPVLAAYRATLPGPLRGRFDALHAKHGLALAEELSATASVMNDMSGRGVDEEMQGLLREKLFQLWKANPPSPEQAQLAEAIRKTGVFRQKAKKPGGAVLFEPIAATYECRQAP